MWLAGLWSLHGIWDGVYVRSAMFLVSIEPLLSRGGIIPCVSGLAQCMWHLHQPAVSKALLVQYLLLFMVVSVPEALSFRDQSLGSASFPPKLKRHVPAAQPTDP